MRLLTKDASLATSRCSRILYVTTMFCERCRLSRSHTTTRRSFPITLPFSCGEPFQSVSPGSLVSFAITCNFAYSPAKCTAVFFSSMTKLSPLQPELYRQTSSWTIRPCKAHYNISTKRSTKSPFQLCEFEMKSNSYIPRSDLAIYIGASWKLLRP